MLEDKILFSKTHQFNLCYTSVHFFLWGIEKISCLFAFYYINIGKRNTHIQNCNLLNFTNKSLYFSLRMSWCKTFYMNKSNLDVYHEASHHARFTIRIFIHLGTTLLIIFRVYQMFRSEVSSTISNIYCTLFSHA